MHCFGEKWESSYPNWKLENAWTLFRDFIHIDMPISGVFIVLPWIVIICTVISTGFLRNTSTLGNTLIFLFSQCLAKSFTIRRYSINICSMELNKMKSLLSCFIMDNLCWFIFNPRIGRSRYTMIILHVWHNKSIFYAFSSLCYFLKSSSHVLLKSIFSLKQLKNLCSLRQNIHQWPWVFWIYWTEMVSFFFFFAKISIRRTIGDYQ